MGMMSRVEDIPPIISERTFVLRKVHKRGNMRIVIANKGKVIGPILRYLLVFVYVVSTTLPGPVNHPSYASSVLVHCQMDSFASNRQSSNEA